MFPGETEESGVGGNWPGVPAATLGILKVFIHGEAMCCEALG